MPAMGHVALVLWSIRKGESGLGSGTAVGVMESSEVGCGGEKAAAALW